MTFNNHSSSLVYWGMDGSLVNIPIEQSRQIRLIPRMTDEDKELGWSWKSIGRFYWKRRTTEDHEQSRRKLIRFTMMILSDWSQWRWHSAQHACPSLIPVRSYWCLDQIVEDSDSQRSFRISFRIAQHISEEVRFRILPKTRKDSIHAPDKIFFHCGSIISLWFWFRNLSKCLTRSQLREHSLVVLLTLWKIPSTLAMLFLNRLIYDHVIGSSHWLIGSREAFSENSSLNVFPHLTSFSKNTLPGYFLVCKSFRQYQYRHAFSVDDRCWNVHWSKRPKSHCSTFPNGLSVTTVRTIDTPSVRFFFCWRIFSRQQCDPMSFNKPYEKRYRTNNVSTKNPPSVIVSSYLHQKGHTWFGQNDWSAKKGRFSFEAKYGKQWFEGEIASEDKMLPDVSRRSLLMCMIQISLTKAACRKTSVEEGKTSKEKHLVICRNSIVQRCTYRKWWRKRRSLVFWWRRKLLISLLLPGK